MSFASKLSPDTAKIGGIGRLEIQVASGDVAVQWFKSECCHQKQTIITVTIFE